MTQTILLADDSLTIQKVVELTFADTQYHVVAVSSGDELLEKLPEVQPEVVICDIIMPEKDGIETIMDMKREQHDLKVLAISGGGRAEPDNYLESARLLGADATMKKPFTHQEMLETIDELLG